MPFFVPQAASGRSYRPMVKLNLLFFPGLIPLAKSALQTLAIRKRAIDTTVLLSGFMVGLVLGANVGSSSWLAFPGFRAEGNDESIYQGIPLSSWIDRLRDHDPFYRLEAVQALEHIGPKEKTAVLSLAKMLNDKNQTVRTATVLALGRLGPEAKVAIPELIACLQDRHRFVRVYAVRALGSIAPLAPEVLPALIAALQDEESIVRWAVLDALGTMGPRAKVAIPAVRKAQMDIAADVRQKAADLLKRIDPQGEINRAIPAVSSNRVRGACSND
jgi:HEAT repeat protein